MTTFVLIHSPLVGPLTWALTAGEIRRQGFEAIVPALTSTPHSPLPYWQQHAEAVSLALKQSSATGPVVLAAHSGAGTLLPAIREATSRPVAAYLFVDAGLPQDGKSRLDRFESPEAAEEFRRAAVGGTLPVWSDDDLREVIPDDEIRRRFVAELRPMPLAVYEEPVPAFDGWPDAPVGYVRFGANPAYDADAARAQREGWPVIQMEGEHFHMLAEPLAVANTLIQMTREIVESSDQG